MKIKNTSLIFALVCFLLLFSLNGYCLFKSSKNVETYDNPDIDYNSYRYFTFFTDKLSIDYLQNKSFQSSIIKLLEEKNYIYVEDIKDANFVIILSSSNLYEESLVNVPIYSPGTKIHPFGLISSIHHVHVHVHGSAHTLGNWGIRIAIKGIYSPFIGISWQGQGIKSTSKSNLEKYGKELIEEILSKFPEIAEKTKEELPPVEIKENENIKMLLEQLKNN
jgi:hypothetical protein